MYKRQLSRCSSFYFESLSFLLGRIKISIVSQRIIHATSAPVRLALTESRSATIPKTRLSNLLVYRNVFSRGRPRANSKLRNHVFDISSFRFRFFFFFLSRFFLFVLSLDARSLIFKSYLFPGHLLFSSSFFC